MNSTILTPVFTTEPLLFISTTVFFWDINGFLFVVQLEGPVWSAGFTRLLKDSEIIKLTNSIMWVKQCFNVQKTEGSKIVP